MPILAVLPIPEEVDCFLQACAEKEVEARACLLGKLPVRHSPQLGLTVACGGLGKTEFAVRTQHLIDAGPAWDLVICAGAAGALVGELAAGDVVVATETVEHDIRNRFGKPHLPRFRCAEMKGVAPPSGAAFRVHRGPIASGDEDVVDVGRRAEVQRLTGALAVAWEGAGGARACRFSGIPFVEVRGVTDNADSSAASDFEANLRTAMRNVAVLVVSWAAAGRVGAG
jgi:adenosylhomocysteine nucleosidase